MILLTDDGTMDTVLVCDGCREEFRGTYAAGYFSDGTAVDIEETEDDYEFYVNWFMEDVEAEHECEEL